MSVFKCKMCGGTIEFNPGDIVGTCDSCGSVQTLPKGNDEVVTNLFNRANFLRMKAEFDKAADIYEKILNEDDTNAEAHWCLVLCRYGIEYVEDPALHKRVPTCHRAHYESVMTDSDYVAAIENSDMTQQEIYTKQAIEISNIQKGILAIVKDEKPFDVFICYKESDENGSRTVDSALANDIYYQLTQEGLKVFYAAITLEDKLGQEYEPYIFAALNSAKVMLVVGTKPEYFNAVWVKNEWSRFLKIINNDRSKLLIPCYRDMDPYELPEEFSHLQAQNMAKIGFVNDIVRGIKKVVEGSKPKAEAVKEDTPSGSSSAGSVSSLLERAFMFLEDGKWQEADSYCEKVLDIEPKNSQAYLGKLMAELEVRTKDGLKDCILPFDDKDNCIKAVKFSAEAAEELKTANDFIRDRNETARKLAIYNSAKVKLGSSVHDGEAAFKGCADDFESISGFKDADELKKKSLEKAEEARKTKVYYNALSELQEAQTEAGCKKASEAFESIIDFKDSKDQIEKCNKKIEKIRADAEEAKCKAEEERIAQEAKTAKTKKILKIVIPVIAAAVVFLIILNKLIIPSNNYKKAASYYAAGDYAAAMEFYEKADGYKDADDKYTESFIALKGTYKAKADKLLESGDNIQAAVNYIKAGEPVLAKRAYDFSSKIAATNGGSAAVTKSNTLLYGVEGDLETVEFPTDVSAITGFDDDSGISVLDSSGRKITSKVKSEWGSNDNNVTESSIDNIKEIAGYYGNYYLLNDGTVTTEPDSEISTDAPFRSWKNIVEIGYCNGDLWGIDSDDNLYYEAYKSDDEYHDFDLTDFTLIQKIDYYRNGWLIGLTKDGKLITASDRNQKSSDLSDLPEGLDLIDYKVADFTVDEDNYRIYVLSDDGTIKYYEADSSDNEGTEVSGSSTDTSKGTYVGDDTGTFKDIVYMQALTEGIIAEDIFGNTYCFGTDSDIKTELTGWKNIVYVCAYQWTYYSDYKGCYNILGIHEDGTVSAFGEQYNVVETVYITEYSWQNDYDIDEHSGDFNNVDSWHLW